ncbi:hypothetical protein BDY19DRAFT_910974 [Irpex rosettiformis]|uniref:Uncharacterized protein n=1 Tax=Irpex rosettiformis TaxID=378272 RepID=A0ACB8TLU4_9APHY|nr:hypothetical protein BDY19DRAFT_910974 [Irpex rosettiformis]
MPAILPPKPANDPRSLKRWKMPEETVSFDYGFLQRPRRSSAEATCSSVPTIGETTTRLRSSHAELQEHFRRFCRTPYRGSSPGGPGGLALTSSFFDHNDLPPPYAPHHQVTPHVRVVASARVLQQGLVSWWITFAEERLSRKMFVQWEDTLGNLILVQLIGYTEEMDGHVGVKAIEVANPMQPTLTLFIPHRYIRLTLKDRLQLFFIRFRKTY